MNWRERKVLVTGGASFIGAALSRALLDRGADVRVTDDLSSGRLERLQEELQHRRIEFIQMDLRDPSEARRAVAGMSVVFHLAADHGGRGYVDRHQAACATNLVLDGAVFSACREAAIDKLVFASSGCVYPNSLQTDVSELLYLREDMIGPPYDADNMYGWAKLMGEMSARAYYQDWGMKSVCCRYFTVYGPGGVENHAIIAMIGRAFVRQDPFVLWGTGEQIRNWTYVDDIVRGTILAAERIEDGRAINLGTTQRVRVADAAAEIMRYMGHTAPIELHPELPTGPYNRVADNSLAKRILGWEPEVEFVEGLRRTIDWYVSTKHRSDVERNLERMLVER